MNIISVINQSQSVQQGSVNTSPCPLQPESNGVAAQVAAAALSPKNESDRKAFSAEKDVEPIVEPISFLPVP